MNTDIQLSVCIRLILVSLFLCSEFGRSNSSVKYYGKRAFIVFTDILLLLQKVFV